MINDILKEAKKIKKHPTIRHLVAKNSFPAIKK